MMELLTLVPKITGTLDRILDCIPKEEMIAKYNSPEGLKIKIEIEGTEVFVLARKKAAEVEL